MEQRFGRHAAIARDRESSRRINEIRAAIADGTYRPPLDSVAESVLAWIAPPELFDSGVMLDPRNAERSVARNH